MTDSENWCSAKKLGTLVGVVALSVGGLVALGLFLRGPAKQSYPSLQHGKNAVLRGGSAAVNEVCACLIVCDWSVQCRWTGCAASSASASPKSGAWWDGPMWR